MLWSAATALLGYFFIFAVCIRLLLWYDYIQWSQPGYAPADPNLLMSTDLRNVLAQRGVSHELTSTKSALVSLLHENGGLMMMELDSLMKTDATSSSLITSRENDRVFPLFNELVDESFTKDNSVWLVFCGSYTKQRLLESKRWIRFLNQLPEFQIRFAFVRCCPMSDCVDTDVILVCGNRHSWTSRRYKQSLNPSTVSLWASRELSRNVVTVESAAHLPALLEDQKNYRPVMFVAHHQRPNYLSYVVFATKFGNRARFVLINDSEITDRCLLFVATQQVSMMFDREQFLNVPEMLYLLKILTPDADDTIIVILGIIFIIVITIPIISPDGDRLINFFATLLLLIRYWCVFVVVLYFVPNFGLMDFISNLLSFVGTMLKRDILHLCHFLFDYPLISLTYLVYLCLYSKLGGFFA